MKTNQNYSILFWIKKNKVRNGEAPLYCRITVNGRRAELSIKLSIEPEKWDSKACKAKGNSEYSRRINVHIDFVKSEIHRHYLDLASKNEQITSAVIKNSYLGIKEEKRIILEVFEYHNKQMEELIGIDFVKATHTKFETVLKKLRKFIKKKYRRGDIPLESLNHKFASDFEYYLKIDEKIGHNTTMKYISNLKKVMNMCVTNEWIPRNPFENFKCTYKKVEREVLTAQELEALSEKHFGTKRLEEVRDVFLFCCYTGFAFIDVQKLTPENLLTGINGGKWIYTHRHKTKQKSNVPLIPPAESLLEKYNDHEYCQATGKLLPVKSNQKMNDYLKEIADLCGIKKTLTMHIARHTFATTVTLANGVPIESVSSMLGHTSIKTTQIYAKVIDQKVSEDMKALSSKISTIHHKKSS